MSKLSSSAMASWFALAGATTSLISGCGGTSASPSVTGGAPSIGGQVTNGGSASVGGSTSAGGSIITGGSSGSSSSGSIITGGSSSSGGIGGSSGAGGNSSVGGSSGSSNRGGSSNAGGSSGAISGTGGNGANGSSSIGGSSNIGGNISTGGSSSSGGTSAVTGTTTSGTTGTVGRIVGQLGPYNWSNVAIVGGGYVPAVVFSPVQKDLVYARTDMGGAYRWDAAGSKWLPLTDWVSFDEWNYLGCESIAPDPKDANRVYIAAGTYTNSWTSLNGQILRSSDRGDSFERFNLPFKVGGNMPGRNMGERLAVDPNKTSVLYLGARSGNGLWRSVDSGETWSKVSSFPSGGNYFQDSTNDYTTDLIGVAWITFDPSSSSAGTASKTIYVGVADTTNGIYRSSDGGDTWAPLQGQPQAGFLPHHGVLASNGMLYLPYSDKGGPYDGGKGDVWKYDTKQSTWTLISPVPSTNTNDDYFGYGGFAVDAQDPNVLVVTSLNSWWPDARFYRSRDAGGTWNPIWDYNGYPTRVDRYSLDISISPWLDWGITKTAPEESPKLGWMTGGISIDPFDSNHMLYGTGATLYATHDLANWDDASKSIHISVEASGIEETAVIDLVVLPLSAGSVLLSGLGDLGGFSHTDITKVPGKLFMQPTFTTTSSIDFAENNPKQVLRVGTVDTGAYPNDYTIGVSNDGGTTWSNAGLPSSASNAAGGSIAVGSDGEYIVWAPDVSGVSVYFSQYSPYSWTASTGIPSQALVKSDRVNKSKFYGFKDGTFYVSTNGGAAFTASPATGLPKSSVKFKAVSGVEGDIWLAGGTTTDVYGLWHSTDSGTSFQKLANVDQADVVGFGKAPSGKNYPAIFVSAKVGGVRGIFRSDDGGATFIRINDDRNQYGSTNSAITGDPNLFGRVYVGTNGRGVICGDIRQ
jgi:xyloglucan-specific exo-beta-1,4-glucanase